MLSSAKRRNYKYAKTTVNVRKKPNTKSKIVGQLNWNDKVRVIKRVNKKWYQVKYKKKKRYVSAQYLRKKKCKYKIYKSPTKVTFKAYEDADYITNSTKTAHGKLKKKYHLDSKTGVWMVGNRYCIAMGSYYSKKIGTKIDLVLCHKGKKRILKCIIADVKSDRHTTNNYRICRNSGGLVEFVVRTSSIPRQAKLMGDVSYAHKKFKGKTIKIKVYK